MTTSTITAPALPRPSSSALAVALLVVLALVAGAAAGAVSASWWHSRTSVVAAPASTLVVPRTALDPATHHYGARSAEVESGLAMTGAAPVLAAPVVVARPALDPASHLYGARAASIEAAVAAAGTGAVLRTPVDPENRFYGRTRLVRPSSPDVVAPVAAAQVSTPEMHLYGARSGS